MPITATKHLRRRRSTLNVCIVFFSVFDDIVIHQNRYVKNEVSNRSFQRKLELRDFFLNPVRGAWKDFSTMANIANVNAYYNQATNTMVVPIGMLQPPLFWSRPKSLTFGAFGIVVGKWVLFLHRFIASRLFQRNETFFLSFLASSACFWLQTTIGMVVSFIMVSFSLCFVASIYSVFMVASAELQVAKKEKGHKGM